MSGTAGKTAHSAQTGDAAPKENRIPRIPGTPRRRMLRGVLPLWRRAWEIRAKREWKQEQKSKMILFYDIISDIIN